MGLRLGFGILLLFGIAVVFVAGSDLKEGEFPILSYKNQDNCSYTIIVETSCSKGAGTTGHVSLRFGDSSSNHILASHLTTLHIKTPQLKSTPTILDDVRTKPFQECATDVFKITGKCMQSPVCYLYLKHGGEDTWRPGRIQVTVAEAPELSSNSFYFRRILPHGVWNGHDLCRGHVTPFGIRKPRKVFTP